MSQIVLNHPSNARRSGYWRLVRRRLIRQVRTWERRPTGQRQREVLAAFVGLLLLGFWSVSINVSSQPLALLSTVNRPANRLSVPYKAKTSENLSTQCTIHESNRFDSINSSTHHRKVDRPSTDCP